MKRTSLTLAAMLSIMPATIAHAQFGSGIVYDPTQSAHAITQIEHEERSISNQIQQIENGQQIVSNTVKIASILLGYPKDRIFNVSKTKIANAETHFNAARPTILKATIAKPPSSTLLSYRYRPKRDILLHYTPDDPNMEPYGFSGAAVWRDSAEHTVPLWTAEPTIFGVQTNAFMTSKLLLVVGGPTIKKFLEESF